MAVFRYFQRKKDGVTLRDHLKRTKRTQRRGTEQNVAGLGLVGA